MPTGNIPATLARRIYRDRGKRRGNRETGSHGRSRLHVKNLRYYKSQPWSFSDTLLMGFFAEVEGDDSITLDREELALAEWFERENIPASESDISLTSEMIEFFRAGK